MRDLRYAAIEGNTSASTPDCEASRILECLIAYVSPGDGTVGRSG